jgi:hypothetical protein
MGKNSFNIYHYSSGQTEIQYHCLGSSWLIYNYGDQKLQKQGVGQPPVHPTTANNMFMIHKNLEINNCIMPKML